MDGIEERERDEVEMMLIMEQGSEIRGFGCSLVWAFENQERGEMLKGGNLGSHEVHVREADLGFILFFFFFGQNKRAFGIGSGLNLAQFFISGISGIFSIFLTFFHIYSKPTNKIKSNKNLKITIIMSINRV